MKRLNSLIYLNKIGKEHKILKIPFRGVSAGAESLKSCLIWRAPVNVIPPPTPPDGDDGFVAIETEEEEDAFFLYGNLSNEIVGNNWYNRI